MEIEHIAAELKAGLEKSRRVLESMARAQAPAPAQEHEQPAAATFGPPAQSPPGAATSGTPAAGSGSEPPRPSAAPAAAGAAGDTPLLVIDDVRAPELVGKVVPEYPEDARRARAEGNVILEAIINTEGDVENVRVLRSVPMLDDAAVAAVKQWKYKPATQGGRPVRVFFTVVVTFTLRDTPPGGAMAAGGGAKDPTAPPTTTLPSIAQMKGLMDMYYGLLGNAIDALSKAQVSLEVSDGYLIVHGRGLGRQGSPLAAFINAQRDVGLPAIGRMMPVNASILIAGQLDWTEDSRVWAKQFAERYRIAMAEMVGKQPGSERSPNDEYLMNLNLWSAHSAGLSDCMRGDLALAMDFSGNGEDNGIRMLQVQGISGSEKCRGILGSLATSFKAGSGKSFMEEEVLEPMRVTTFVARRRDPKEPPPSGEARSAKESGQTAAAPKNAPEPGALRSAGVSMVRYAQVGDLLILGTDPWASEAIREASLAREGSPPGGGGLVLADLGPFTQRPGVFGRMQMGSILRASLKNAKDSEPREKLMEALEGPAGAIPFAMRFDEGAASLEFALPLAMFEAMAKSRPPRPAPPSMGAASGQQGYDDDEGGEGDEP